jgi:hypothetical protein
MALLVGRLVLAAVLVSVGAVTNRAWLVPVAATIAVPILWPDSLAMLLAAVYLIRHAPKGSPRNVIRESTGARLMDIRR